MHSSTPCIHEHWTQPTAIKTLPLYQNLIHRTPHTMPQFVFTTISSFPRTFLPLLDAFAFSIIYNLYISFRKISNQPYWMVTSYCYHPTTQVNVAPFSHSVCMHACYHLRLFDYILSSFCHLTHSYKIYPYSDAKTDLWDTVVPSYPEYSVALSIC